MESSIRDIIIFWKLSRGMENDNALTLQKLMTWSYIPNIDRGPYNLPYLSHDSWPFVDTEPRDALGWSPSVEGAHVPRSFDEFGDLIAAVYQVLVKAVSGPWWMWQITRFFSVYFVRREMDGFAWSFHGKSHLEMDEN